jgi:hypothetical protein
LIVEKQNDKLSLIKNSFTGQQNKEYVDFFGEDKKLDNWSKKLPEMFNIKSSYCLSTNNLLTSNNIIVLIR